MEKIPKVIHYCWFSDENTGKFPELIQKCIDSWEKKLPDYRIKCWNTENFDVNICQYTREAFQKKKYAFVSDYVRLYALYYEGGIYLDSDIEVLKTFDNLLDNLAFTGFENSHAIATCVLGSVKGNPLFKQFMDYYADRPFILSNGEYDLTPNPIPITDICMKHGLSRNGKEQKLDYITIYPMDYFCPYDRITGELNITENSYTIHYFNGTWIDEERKQIITKRKLVIQKYGKLAGYFYYSFLILTQLGFKQFVKECFYFAKKIID